jgi:hypothetical protein
MSDPLSDTLRWALQFGIDPATSCADWMAREIDETCDSADAAVLKPLDDSDDDLHRLRLFKSAFKTLRLNGESSLDRRTGARYYAAVLAAAIVRHNVRITSQRPQRLREALQGLSQDTEVDARIRDLAQDALHRLDEAIIPEDA